MLLQQLQLFVHCVHCMPSSSCNTQHEVDAGVKIPAAGEHYSFKELQALHCPALRALHALQWQQFALATWDVSSVCNLAACSLLPLLWVHHAL
jgi:hypothetical protein